MKRWLPDFKELKTGSRDNWEEWADEYFEGFDEENPALTYSEVFGERFDSKETQQREIENLTKGKEPGFGYAVLAQLMSHEDFGNNFNMVLTTNFDDMVADALYLFTNKKPLVIVHESLISYVRLTRTRALVIKLHGDALLDPKNTRIEIGDLSKAVKETVKRILSETGLIFMGYGGNDIGIEDILREMPKGGLGGGIYWVNDTLPDNKFGEWLESSDATWVNHLDFDEVMLLVRKEFDLGRPDMGRFMRLENQYNEAIINIRKKVEGREDTTEKEFLEEAVEEVESEFTGWWEVESEAGKYMESEPDKAEKIYQEGIDKSPDSSELLGRYASFLKNHRKDYKRADEFYRRSIEAYPKNPVSLGNYALTHQLIHNNFEQAEEYYKRALDADPVGGHVQFNYASLLFAMDKPHEGKELLNKAFELAREDRAFIKYWFLRYAHFNEVKHRIESLVKIKELIGEGVRSLGWNLEKNVKRAVEDGHPESEMLAVLSKVIADEEKAEALEEFKAWREA